MSTIAWVLLGGYVAIGLLWYFLSIGLLANEIEDKRPSTWRFIKTALLFALAWPFVGAYGYGQVLAARRADEDDNAI